MHPSEWDTETLFEMLDEIFPLSIYAKPDDLKGKKRNEAAGRIQVTGKEDLLLHLKHLLSDERACKEMGEKGFQFLQKHRGATERVFKEIRPFFF